MINKIKEFFSKIRHALFDYIPLPEEVEAAKHPENAEDAAAKALADVNNPGSVLNQTTKFF